MVQRDPLHAPLLLGVELGLISILLIALHCLAAFCRKHLAMALAEVRDCSWKLDKICRHLPIFIHNIFILIYWQHLEKLASLQHQLDFIKKNES